MDTNQETTSTTSTIDVSKLKVITLCGSTRFKTAFREWEARLEIEEPAVVLSVAMWSPTAKVMPTPAQNELLDAIHLRKIDLSDEIFVLEVPRADPWLPGSVPPHHRRDRGAAWMSRGC